MRSAFLTTWVIVLTIVRTGAAADIDAAALFAQLDADRDGAVTAAEAGDEHVRLFARLVRTGDDDGDGRLTADEFAVALTPVRADKTVTAKQGSRLPGGDALVVIVAMMDANGDRQLVKDEIPARLREPFARMVQQADEDKDGRLDTRELAQGGPRLAIIAQTSAARLGIDIQAELAKLPPARRQAIEGMSAYPNPRELMANPQQAAELFARLDANGDKLLASDEAPEGLANLIRRADRDGDGKLSQNEFQAAARRMSAGNNGSPPDSAAGRGNMRQLLTRWDRNGDGALSRAEAPPRMARTFDQLDQDGNGSLSARELQQFRPSRARPQRPVTDAQPVEMDEEMQQ